MQTEMEGMSEVRVVPLEWSVPPDLITRYATSIVVQHTEHEFTLSLFDVQPPIILGTPDERTMALSQVRRVTATCVARIVVAPGRMQEFIDVLQTNLNAYNAEKG